MTTPVKRLSTEALVTRIRRLRTVPGTSFTGIARALNSEGIACRRGTTWTQQDVSTFIARYIDTEDEARSTLDLPEQSSLPMPEFLEEVPDTITLELTPEALEAIGGDGPTMLAEASDFSVDSTIQLSTEMVEEVTTVVDGPAHPQPAASPGRQLSADLDRNDIISLVQSYKWGDLRDMLEWFRSESGPRRRSSGAPAKPSFAGPTKSVTLAISARVLVGAQKKMVGDKEKVGKNLSQLVEYLLWEYQGSPEGLVADIDYKK